MRRRRSRLGELQSLRESAGLSLDRIITETKISRRLLEALESGRFQLLPERIFSRNFVSQYAAIVGADASRVLELFDAAWAQFLIESGSHPAALAYEPPLATPVRWRFWIPIALCAVILTGVGIVILKGSAREGRPAGDQSPWEGPRAGNLRLPDRATPTARPTEVPPLVAAAQEGQEDDMVDLSLTVAGGSECWIRYRDREGRTGQQLLARGQDLEIELIGPVLLTLGNAAAVTLRVGGVEYRDLGLPGQVLHTEVSRHGVVLLGGGGSSE